MLWKLIYMRWPPPSCTASSPSALAGHIPIHALSLILMCCVLKQCVAVG